MTFRVELELQGDLPRLSYSNELDVQAEPPLSAHDELVHVLSAQCRALSSTGKVRFFVGGFGQERWPVDVETDLAVALEQLPEVLAGLAAQGRSFQLNFYEQGIERYLTGTVRDQTVTFECMSLSLKWTADPSSETLSLEDAKQMFCELRDRYCAAVEQVSPWLAHAPSYEQWKRAVSSSVN